MKNEEISMKILATGGAGYIGSHTCAALLEKDYDVVAVDNLYNSSEEAIRRVRQITGKELRFYNADVCDAKQLDDVFEAEPGIDAVMHFAGYKAVGESVAKPLEYYSNNLNSTMILADVMRKHGCKNIIFSSSATVYGENVVNPLTEEMPKGRCSNPYGWTKWMIEQILTDLHTSDPEWNVVLLRYFNPIGAHPSGLIGEDPKGIPNNLLPYVAQVAVGKLQELGVFGDDYDTPDGTGVRDYVHVMDLAYGHVAALKRIRENCGVDIYNLGTGRGSSVLEVVRSFEKACGKSIPYSIRPRRPGDIDANWCDPSKAEKELGWKAEYNLDDMCRDAWNWQSRNPDGYGK